MDFKDRGINQLIGYQWVMQDPKDENLKVNAHPKLRVLSSIRASVATIESVHDSVETGMKHQNVYTFI